MRKKYILPGVVAIAMTVGGGTAVAHHQQGHGGGACPTSSPAGGGDPSCGKPKPTPPPPPPVEECTLGTIGNAVVGLGAPEPVGGLLRDILCGLADAGIRP